MRIFLPFTINLDPYLRKVLKEDQQAMEDEGIIIPIKPTNIMSYNNRNSNNYYQQPFAAQHPLYPTAVTNSPIAMMNYFNSQSQNNPSQSQSMHSSQQQQQQKQHFQALHQNKSNFPSETFENSLIQNNIFMDVYHNTNTSITIFLCCFIVILKVLFFVIVLIIRLWLF